MEKNIKIISNLLLNKIQYIIDNPETIKKSKFKMYICEYCKKELDISFIYNNREKKNNKIEIKEVDIHKLKFHNIINI